MALYGDRPGARDVCVDSCVEGSIKNTRVSERPLIQPIIEPFQSFIHTEASGGILLLLATFVAMIWANSPWAASYDEFWSTPVSLTFGASTLKETLRQWINDGLMAMFFFVIGLEIKREILVGEFASWRQAELPLAAAVGGSVLPALLFTVFNAGTEGAKVWGVPMATDIAFSLGILSLVGACVPLALKVFLTALAIALFYTSTISWISLGLGAIFLVLLIGANWAGVGHLLVYSVVGIGGLWLAFLFSGVHAAVAGVIAAMTIPACSRLTGREFVKKGKGLLWRFEQVLSPDQPPLANQERHQIARRMKNAVAHVETPLQQLEHALHPWVIVVIMPVFALANAGVSFDADISAMLLDPIALGGVCWFTPGEADWYLALVLAGDPWRIGHHARGCLLGATRVRWSDGRDRLHDVAIHRGIGVSPGTGLGGSQGRHPDCLNDGRTDRMVIAQVYSETKGNRE